MFKVQAIWLGVCRPTTCHRVGNNGILILAAKCINVFIWLFIGYHLARATYSLPYAEIDDDPGQEEAEAEIPLDGPRFVYAR